MRMSEETINAMSEHLRSGGDRHILDECVVCHRLTNVIAMKGGACVSCIFHEGVGPRARNHRLRRVLGEALEILGPVHGVHQNSARAKAKAKVAEAAALLDGE